jgi:hypothetical protein
VANSGGRLGVNLGIRPCANRPDLANFDGLVIDEAINDPPGIAANDELAKSGQVTAQRVSSAGGVEQ